ncbi:MAG: hypothetical protein ACREBW_05985, partial [Candidatus Micrarchaeaceae archaeon]
MTLYGDTNGTMKLWQSTITTPIDSNGIFNCVLGTGGNPLPEPSVIDRPLWLGVSVDNGPELRPLSEVTASAYALNVVDNAITTAKLADNSVTSAKIADSSITASKMNLDYVSSININGVQFTGHGTPLNVQGENGIEVAYKADSNILLLRGTGSSGQNTPIANGDGGSDWSETGNDSTTPGTNYVGTSDNNKLYFKVNGTTVMRYVPTTGEPNIIGGNVANSITGNGSVIAGGGTSGNANSITADYSVIGGGYKNQITSEDTASVIGGGGTNTINGLYGFIGGGRGNTVSQGNDGDDFYSVVTG